MALDYDWENSVGYWICAASHSLRKALDSRLNKEGITIRQWEVLAWLSARGCGSQSEIADQLGIKPHTLVGVLSRMEKAKLITRRSSQEDRRKKLFMLRRRLKRCGCRSQKLLTTCVIRQSRVCRRPISTI